VAVFFARHNNNGPVTVIVGKDTRESGDMLESALSAGICAMGANVHLVDVLPTPGISFLTVAKQADAGIVISASHNPYTDNGIKVFNRDGYKLSVDQEAELEALILSDQQLADATGQVSCGRIYHQEDDGALYADFLKTFLQHDDFQSSRGSISRTDDLKLVIDCANGATSTIVEKVFPDANTLFASPDGKNINNECGSEHTETLCRQVVEQGASAGFAFDGDGDRVTAVDELGNILSGDRILAVCAEYFKSNQLFRNNMIVSTVMSNIGLTRALKDMGIAHVATDVGDRHVMEKMRACDAQIGGEDSGHIIFADYQTTGDGMLTALILCEIMTRTGKPLSVLASCMTVCPQEIINVTVKEKPDLSTLASVRKVIAATEASLGESGRVLVRYSGTQPMCRVMVEAATSSQAKDAAESLAEAVRQRIGV